MTAYLATLLLCVIALPLLYEAFRISDEGKK